MATHGARLAAGVCLFALFTGTSADAQYVVKSGISLERPTTETAPSIHDSPVGSQASFSVLARRTAGASAGWFLVAVIGAYVGYNVLSHDCNGCDDPGLDAILQGAVVGGAIGAGLGAAGPTLESGCSFGTRLGRGLLGSVTGTAIGFLVRPSESKVVAVPLLSISGAALAEWRC